VVEMPATDSTTYEIMFKVIDVPLEKLIEVVKPHVIRITDVREA
jgi:hypothetical protein